MRRYLIHGKGSAVYPAYVVVQSAGLLGQYYDVQGSTFTAAPLFANPDQTVTVGGRTYDFYFQGAHVRTIAWFEHGAVYWIHNTLLDSVGNGEMLAIAEQTTPVGQVDSLAKAQAARLKLSLHGAKAPVRYSSAIRSSTSERLGWIAGLLVLAVLPLLLFAVIRRWFEHRRLRAELRTLDSRVLELSDTLDRARRRRLARAPAAPIEPIEPIADPAGEPTRA